MNNEEIHRKICNNSTKISDWFVSQREGFVFPVYTSVDIRDAGFKVAPVDANIFPAGFNNICEVDRDSAPEIFRGYIQRHYGSECQKILLLAEENTKNLYYWDNVLAIVAVIQGAGFKVRVAMPSEFDEPILIQAASGNAIEVYSAKRSGGGVELKDSFVPDLIISNNDFSLSYQEWAEGLEIPMNPPRGLGWYQRKKSHHFKFYNELAADFARQIDVDPWYFTINTSRFEKFQLSDDKSRDALAELAEQTLSELRIDYKERGIDSDPFLFVKHNSGTYGMAVVQAKSGDDIKTWNARVRKKLKKGKGGREIDEMVVQEGVPSRMKTEDGASAEPAIYMIGCDLAGGFLRTHSEKSETESLNSPGAVFKRLCMSDLKIDVGGCPMENVYGWVARLSQLAIGHEAREMGVEFRGAKLNGCD